MHEYADENSSVVSQAKYAEQVIVLKEQSNWLLVKSSDNYEGWVQRNEIIHTDNYHAKNQLVTTLNREVLVYSSASVGEHKPLIKLPFGIQLVAMDEVIKWEKRWVKIQLLDGQIAWIQRGDINIGSFDLDIKEMVKLSKSFIGTPYTWGGRSSFGFDCSGFVQEMYKAIGVYIPRDSGPQSKWGGLIQVSQSSLKPGDLLFFGNKKVTHVGLFLSKSEGNLLFINATVADNDGNNAPYLQISDLNSKYWSKLFIEAKRLK
nr:SH3 domain-containing C40 family peptidase [Vibrio hepatarius]